MHLPPGFRSGRIGVILTGCLLLVFFLAGSGPVRAAMLRKPVKAGQQEIALAGKLKTREAKLAAREKALADKEAALAGVQKDVGAKLDRLLALQKDLEAKLTELKRIRDKRFKNLIKIYSAMSASKVAPLVNKMEDRDALEILKGLKADQVAKIIPKLDPDKAIRLSRKLGLI